jgi:hypothetical protein
MTISFNPLKANGQLFTHLPELDDLEVSLSNANAADVLDTLGIEDSFSASPWPLPCFKALLIVARRKRLGHASPAIRSREPRRRGWRDPHRVGLRPHPSGRRANPRQPERTAIVRSLMISSHA